ncbi:MAG: Gfo/Idh/MocA family oxidoreductase [Anaerolineae bacterium]
MKVGIAGVGFMGTTHAAGWSATDVELVGFCAETTQEAQALAQQYHTQVYPDFAALLNNVDVIDICTPTHLHHDQVLQAAAAGKHIICEKPLARTVAQGQEMIRACRAAGVKLFVAHVVRFFPEYALAHDTVARGDIGRPAVTRLVRGSYRPKKPIGNWFLDVEKSGGMMLDLMIHDFDYARWISGEVESVFAKRVGQQHPESATEYGLAILKHTNGALSHVTGAWAYPPPTFRTGFEIAGDAGLIEWTSESTEPIKMLLRKDNADAPDVGLPGSPVAESPYTTQIKEFYAALKADRTARVSAGDGLAAVQIALAAIESAQTGQPIKINPLPEVAA